MSLNNSIKCYNENKSKNLPYETIVGDVIYEYGEYIYRIKGFVKNNTGVYRIRNKKSPVEGKDLKLYFPVEQIESERLMHVRKIIFETVPRLIKNFSLPCVNEIEVEDSSCKCMFYKGCLFDIHDDEELKLIYAPNNNIEEITIPFGFRVLSLHIDSDVQLNHLKRIKVPDDVRLVKSIATHDCLVEIDNVEENVLVLDNTHRNTYKYSGVANPKIDFEFHGYKCTIIGENEVSIADTPDSKEVVPNVVQFNGKEYKVTAISDFGFKNSKLVTISIGRIKKIGFGAFYHSDKLREVDFYGNLDIDDYAFAECNKLRVFFSGVPKEVVNIGKHAFKNCKFLKEVIIPNPIGTIKSGAFYNCTFLESITLPDIIGQIEEFAFSRLVNIIFTGDIPKMNRLSWGFFVENVYYGASKDFGVLSDVFDEKALRYGCPVYRELVKVPDGAKSIGKNSFLWGKPLNGYDGRYERSVYEENETLKYIYLPDSVKSIEDESFTQINNLEYVYIDNDKYIGGYELYERDENNDLSKIIWVTPKQKIGVYTLPETTKSIAKHAFFKADIDEVVLHNQHLFIDEYAFEKSRIEKIKLYPNTELFDKHVFKNAIYLTEIVDQSGMVYNEELVDDYLRRFNDKVDEIRKHIIDIPEGSTDKQQILSNFYYALVESACEKMMHGEAYEWGRRDDNKMMNVSDLFAYKDIIDELLSVNTDNPTLDEMDGFVNNSSKYYIINSVSYRKTNWHYNDISGCYSHLRKTNSVVAHKSIAQLPSLSYPKTK